MFRSFVVTAASLTLACSAVGGGEIAAKAGDLKAGLMGLPIECAQALEAESAEGRRCLNYRLGGVFADYAAHLIEKQGQALFGGNFGFVHRLSWSPFDTGTSRDLDAVIPLQFAPSGAANAGESALFLQHGITRWSDNEGFTRNDIRQGIVYRLALPDDPVSVFGVAAFVQENVERKHRRLTMSLDYTGRYGRGWLQHFMPASGWQPGRVGYEERPIGGTEAGTSLGITSTLSLDAALARWDIPGSGAGSVDSRVGFGLRPHPWLQLRAEYESGFRGQVANIHALLAIPLGGVQQTVPRWEGLGSQTRAFAATTAPSDLWQPVGNVTQLQTVERLISPAVEARAGSVAVAFLQDEAASGSNVGVQVSIPTALSEDLHLILRLVPGSGDNPAVPGEDFVDEPKEVTIHSGELTVNAWFQLLYNPSQQTDRRLAVTVSLAS